VKLSNVDAITFDFYNTLVTHENGRGRGVRLMAYFQQVGLSCDPWEHRVLYDVFAPHAIEYDPAASEELRSAYRTRLTDRLFRRLNVRGSEAAPAAHADRVWQIVGPASLHVFPEVPRVLAQLRSSGIPLAIISNWQCGLGHFCTELGLAAPFQHVIASAEVGAEKPQQEIFDEARHRLGVPAHRILHIGDTLVDDFVGGAGAGFQVLLIERGQRNDSGVPSIRSLEEVSALVGLSRHA
jgi:putative hydrolase of the HAD superfamily